MIRENMAIKEAQAAKTSIFEYNIRSNGALDYRCFINEFLDLIKEDNPEFTKLEK